MLILHISNRQYDNIHKQSRLRGFCVGLEKKKKKKKKISAEPGENVGRVT